MGLLDWLTDGIGSQMGGSSSQPMVDATSNYTSPGSAPLSPDEMPGAPPAAPPALAVPSQPPSDPSSSPVPLPAPRPPGADAGPPQPTFAPNQTNTNPISPPAPGYNASPLAPGGGALSPADAKGVVKSYEGAGGHAFAPPAPNPDSGPGAPPVKPYQLGDQTALGRSLGIDPQSNGFKSAMAGLGEGLTAAGNSKGKSAGAAFGAGAGGALTGGTKQDNTQYDQRIKALQLAVNAQAAGDKSAYNKNYAEYLKGKLANDEAKAAAPGGGKSGSWNKPDSQKFIDAQNAMAKDPDIRASQKVLEGAIRDGNQTQIAQAQAAHNALVQQKQGMYLSGVGLNPAQIQANITNPPGTPQNPHVVTSKADFDTYVKPGQAYKNPSDGKIYIRKSADQKDDDAADTPASAASAPSAPAPPGPAPGTAAAPASADDED